jgi:phage terminase Nu1 subunit (DNA packaging protein)
MAKEGMKRSADDVTAAELGAWIALSEQAVRDLTRRGIVVRSGRGRYALRASIQAYCQHQRKAVTGRGAEAAAATARDRGRLARAQADLAEAKAQSVRGELVEASAVEAEWSGVLRTVRAGCFAIPSRAAQRLPHLTTHAVALIDAEVRAALTEIGSG